MGFFTHTTSRANAYVPDRDFSPFDTVQAISL